MYLLGILVGWTLHRFHVYMKDKYQIKDLKDFTKDPNNEVVKASLVIVVSILLAIVMSVILIIFL